MLRELVGDLLIIGLGSLFLFHLVLIALHGEVRIYEEIKPVVWTEIALVTGCVLLGIERLIKDMRK